MPEDDICKLTRLVYCHPHCTYTHSYVNITHAWYFQLRTKVCVFYCIWLTCFICLWCSFAVNFLAVTRDRARGFTFYTMELWGEVWDGFRRPSVPGTPSPHTGKGVFIASACVKYNQECFCPRATKTIWRLPKMFEIWNSHLACPCGRVGYATGRGACGPGFAPRTG